MSASWSGSMKGPRVKTLLLLLLLLSALTGTVLCQDGDGGDKGAKTEAGEGENNEEETSESSADLHATPSTASMNKGVSASAGFRANSTVKESTVAPTLLPVEDGLSLIIILIPVVLVVLIIGMIVCGIFINRRWNKKANNQELGKEDPYLDASSTEKVPMPMFEEDVPSVLELEMDELDQWMKKDEDSKHA